MRVLFIGDIVGKPGRTCLKDILPGFREEKGIDLIIANGENAAGGSGITGAISKEILGYGVDAITLGDHVWDQRGFPEEIDELEGICRPANLPGQCPGKPYLIVEHNGFRLGVFTVLGRQFMKLQSDCPYAKAVELIEEMRSQCDAILVEMHAETTSEKIAMGWYLDGRAAVVVGTHTHTPTADFRILPRGTAYQTDAGMTGPYESILGREIQPILGKLLDGMPRRWPVASGDVRMCGLMVDIDPKTGRSTACERVEVGSRK